VAAIGATVVNLLLVDGAEDLSGIRFSYNDALYETGRPISQTGAVWQVPIFPAIRAQIPSGAQLEVTSPTCLVKLATDREMDVTISVSGFDQRDVSFVEAVDYWSDLANGRL